MTKPELDQMARDLPSDEEPTPELLPFPWKCSCEHARMFLPEMADKDVAFTDHSLNRCYNRKPKERE